MPAALNIADILSHVRNLGKEDQFTLLESLILLIRKNNDGPENLTLSSLTGLGSEIWRDTDIDQYIDKERQW